MHGSIQSALLLVASRTTRNQFSYFISSVIPPYAVGQASGFFEKAGADGVLTPYIFNTQDAADYSSILSPFLESVLTLAMSLVPVTIASGSDSTADIVMNGIGKNLYLQNGEGVLAFAHYPSDVGGIAMDITFLPGGVGSAGAAHGNLAYELLHTLGLNDAKNIGLGSEENGRYTLMSYVNHPDERRLVNQPQLYDVAALQSIFGRNSSANAGATSYTNFISTDQDSLGQDAIYSIWDSGGLDTINASALTKSAFIDLRPGYFSSIGPLNNVVVNTGASPALANPGWLNISVAFGSYIENATGGSVNDYITGNILTNTLSGGAGDDVLYAEDAVTNYDTGLADYRRITNSGDYTLAPVAAIQAFISNPAAQRDALYGDAGNDYLASGRGGDLLHGGARSSTTSQQSAIESDGADIADYAPLGLLDATKGVAIRVTDQAIDATLAANVDAGFGTWVTDRGRGGATDLLVSIETVKATAADDVLVVTKLDPSRLAGADGTGGLATVDLGGQSAGDLIDLSPATKGMTVTFGSTTQVFATDTPALKLAVLGAEQVLGSASADVLTGGTAGDVLAGGGGADTISGGAGADTLFSGTSTDVATADSLTGGDGDDWLIAEAGSSATLRGQGGADTFYVTRSDVARTVTLNGSMNNDKLVWNGHALDKGTLYHLDAEGNFHVFQTVYGYLGEHGEVYRLVERDPATPGDLIVTLPDASRIVIHDWSQGKLGIVLGGGAMPSYGVEFEYPGQYAFPFSKLRDDGVLLTEDWDLIDGGLDALTKPGSIAAPVPPSAFVPVPAASPVELGFASPVWAAHPAPISAEGLAQLC